MQMQMQQMQAENDGLRKTATTLKNTLSTIGSRRGNGVAPPMDGSPVKVGEANSDKTTSAVVNQARNALAPASELPT